MIDIIKSHKKLITTGLIATIVLIIGIICIISIATSKTGEVVTITEASLKELFEISELSTIEYTYNSIATVTKTKKDKEEDIYHVAYEGTVKAGFDFNEIKVTHKPEEKKYYIDIPEIKIHSVIVDETSLEFIFTKDKYETETIYQQAYKKSIADLESKANGENGIKLKTLAEENSIATMDALLAPWKEQLPEGYSIEYK